MIILLSEVQPLHPQKTLFDIGLKIILQNADMFVFFAFGFVACDPATVVFLLPSKTNVHVLIQVKIVLL